MYYSKWQNNINYTQFKIGREVGWFPTVSFKGEYICEFKYGVKSIK